MIQYYKDSFGFFLNYKGLNHKGEFDEQLEISKATPCSDYRFC